MIYHGWSVNLNEGAPFQVAFPVPPLYTGPNGAVLEVVFWAPAVGWWIHGVSQLFERQLPLFHFQTTVADSQMFKELLYTKGAHTTSQVMAELTTDAVG